MQTIDQQLDGLVQLDRTDLAGMIARTEAKLRLLRALAEVPDVVPTPVSKLVPPKKASRPPESGRRHQVGERTAQVARFLMAGPRKASAASAELGIPTSCLFPILKLQWFEKISRGTYQLTPAGRKEFGWDVSPGAVPKPATKPPSPLVYGKAADGLPDRLGAFLKANGPKRSDSLRNALGVNNEQLEELLQHPWFEKDGGMFTLTNEGHVEFSKDQER